MWLMWATRGEEAAVQVQPILGRHINRLSRMYAATARFMHSSPFTVY